MQLDVEIGKSDQGLDARSTKGSHVGERRKAAKTVLGHGTAMFARGLESG